MIQEDGCLFSNNFEFWLWLLIFNDFVLWSGMMVLYFQTILHYEYGHLFSNDFVLWSDEGLFIFFLDYDVGRLFWNEFILWSNMNVIIFKQLGDKHVRINYRIRGIILKRRLKRLKKEGEFKLSFSLTLISDVELLSISEQAPSWSLREIRVCIWNNFTFSPMMSMFQTREIGVLVTCIGWCT